MNIVIAMLLASSAGCAASSRGAASDPGPTATCHVCRYNNDLACVSVKLEDTTPRTEYQGETYYFCSDDCRTVFAQNPQKYLP